nr:protein sap1 [Quercus suber]
MSRRYYLWRGRAERSEPRMRGEVTRTPSTSHETLPKPTALASAESVRRTTAGPTRFPSTLHVYGRREQYWLGTASSSITMMRKANATSSMQKTYDECYLICSTAIYFEGQIYYHNAYKLPSSYVARTETEKALQDSLRAMELQCKERVDLLEALRKSRQEAEEEAKENGRETPSKCSESLAPPIKPTSSTDGPAWLGLNTVRKSTGESQPRPPALPSRRPLQTKRPSYVGGKSSDKDALRTMSMQSTTSAHLAPPTSKTPPRDRTPSPEKKAGGMLRTLRSTPKDRTSSGKMAATLRTRPVPAAAKAASQVWSGQQRPSLGGVTSSSGNITPVAAGTTSGTTWDPYTRTLVREQAAQSSRRASDQVIRPPSPTDFMNPRNIFDAHARNPPPYPEASPYDWPGFSQSNDSVDASRFSQPPPSPPPHRVPSSQSPPTETSGPAPSILSAMGPPSSMAYMKEYPNHPPAKPPKPSTIASKPAARTSDSESASSASQKTVSAKASPTIPRRAVGRATGVVSAVAERQKLDSVASQLSSRVKQVQQVDPVDLPSSPEATPKRTAKRKVEAKSVPAAITPPSTDDSPDSDQPETPTEQQISDARIQQLMKNLPRGVDEAAAKQIFNEIVVQGDEVHWDDVAGLEIAKSALKETVVYPFLRPDLFMGLREPARGMLLFGPPGTGKTMLARAVATESKSVFFAISASSLTSKFLGESEKLVRALFAIAKALAPSIIFVDEIDSLLGARGGGSEHEATRRIKTEFLIGWSDLQKAAAGREDKDKGDATRVLVLAATNLPWAIDEAARRRFVRRQYIPLPEDWVREKQLSTLLASQKHNLHDRELKRLVRLTDGYSGSDITALAKDAAMGPLRSLGERLLHMSPEDIRGIGMQDFEASLVNIRPSVSKAGLKEFEDWAKEFGERGG